MIYDTHFFIHNLPEKIPINYHEERKAGERTNDFSDRRSHSLKEITESSSVPNVEGTKEAMPVEDFHNAIHQQVSPELILSALVIHLLKMSAEQNDNDKQSLIVDRDSLVVTSNDRSDKDDDENRVKAYKRLVKYCELFGLYAKLRS